MTRKLARILCSLLDKPWTVLFSLESGYASNEKAANYVHMPSLSRTSRRVCPCASRRQSKRAVNIEPAVTGFPLSNRPYFGDLVAILVVGMLVSLQVHLRQNFILDFESKHISSRRTGRHETMCYGGLDGT